MVEIIRADRKSAVLTPSALACLSRIPTVNLTSGCSHGCIYCYTQGYSSYPGEGRVKVYVNTLAKLREELPRKRKKPRAVYFSPSSDIFQPIPEVADLTYDIIEFLFEMNVGVAFLTKGAIPKRHMDLLCSNPTEVRAQIGLTTLDRELSLAFEPNAAVPEARLLQAEDLLRAGVPTEIRMDPILPGLTDGQEILRKLCAAISRIGVKEVAASLLFLRPAVVASMKRHLNANEEMRALLARYEKAQRLRIHADRSGVIALPVEARRRIYACLQDVAQAHGIKIKVCGCKNPDIAAGSCNIAGSWPGGASQARRATPRVWGQQGLWEEAEGGH